jgi:hypothetical protein
MRGLNSEEGYPPPERSESDELEEQVREDEGLADGDSLIGEQGQMDFVQGLINDEEGLDSLWDHV